MNGNGHERAVNTNSVMQRIQETEMEEYCSKMPQDGVSKGMEIALNLRSRMKQDHLAKQSPSSIRTSRNETSTDGIESPSQPNRAGVVKKLNKIFSTFVDENTAHMDNTVVESVNGCSSVTSSVSPFESEDSNSCASSLSRSSGSSLGHNMAEQFHPQVETAPSIQPISYRKFNEDVSDSGRSGNSHASSRIYRLWNDFLLRGQSMTIREKSSALYDLIYWPEGLKLCYERIIALLCESHILHSQFVFAIQKLSCDRNILW